MLMYVKSSYHVKMLSRFYIFWNKPLNIVRLSTLSIISKDFAEGLLSKEILENKKVCSCVFTNLTLLRCFNPSKTLKQ